MIVMQTRVQIGKKNEFARWRQKFGEAASVYTGFIEQTVMPPNSPAQTDWVIFQWFASAETAVAWLKSNRRFELLQGAAPMLIGQQDTHIINDAEAGVLPAPACAVISTRVKPGAEAAYRI